MKTISEIDSFLDFGALLQRYLPRGKGAVIRAIGKRFIRPESRYMLTRHGAKLVLSPDSMDVYTTMRIDGNAWDYRDFEICYASTPDGGVFFDIGANVGYFTVEMVALTGSKVTSIGFEANASLTSAIARTIEINGYAENLIIVDALVGDRDGEAKFFIAPASIHSSAVADSNRGVTHAITKRMIALDTIVGSGELPPPDFIKMDIEGSEHLAFRGGAKMLREHRPHIFFEYLHEDDIGGRVRAEFEALVLETGCYDVYVSPSSNLRARHASMLVPYSGPEDLTNSDAVYLRNRQRPVRNADIFGI